MKMVNLTYHPINEVDSGTYIEKSGVAGRVNKQLIPVKETEMGIIYERKITGVSFFDIETEQEVDIETKFPDADYFIVSTEMKLALNNPKFISPGTRYRTQDGITKGCHGYIIN